MIQIIYTTYVCTYVCMYVCMYACMYVRTYVCMYALPVEIITVTGHLRINWPGLSDQNMFASDIKDRSKDIGRCISHCLYMSPTVYPIKTLHLVARRYYMVPTQGGVSFPLECGLFYCLLLLPGIMSDQNNDVSSTSTFVRSLINSYNLHCTTVYTYMCIRLAPITVTNNTSVNVCIYVFMIIL